jgi:hypothetical protein
MAVVFNKKNHTYTDENNEQFISVTTLISAFKQPFDADKVATKVSKNKKSKWYGLTPDQIKDIWKNESDRSCTLGNWYHDQREADYLSCETMVKYGAELNIIKSIIDNDGNKFAGEQRLVEGIYPEHMVYLNSAKICGQSDLVEVINGKVHITDYKTNKEIKTESFVNWQGISQRMLGPLGHLDDCNLNHYTLQLSIYMYMILKHNPNLKPGTLTINHVIFEEEGSDEYGYPIMKLTEQGDPIVKEVIHYDLPYLKDEVMAILAWLSQNRDKVVKK